MLKYLLKRILIFIPTLFFITLISFVLSLNAPGDPVERMLTGGESSDDGQSAERAITERQYLQKRKELGLDLPVFYFSLTSAAYPDTLHRIEKKFEREALAELISTYGNWPAISNFYHQVNRLQDKTYQIVTDTRTGDPLIQFKYSITELKQSALPKTIVSRMAAMDTLIQQNEESLGGLRNSLKRCQELWEIVITESTPMKTYVPSFNWYGAKNQYHRWFTGLFRGDFGKSYYDKRPVIKRISESLPWTLFLNIFAILVAYMIAVPIGVYSARNRNTLKDQTLSTFLYVLYSLPSFWVATLMITFLCNPEYFHLFPTSGVMSENNTEAWPLMKRLGDYAYHLFLPSICFTYASFAFLSRQMRTGMLETLNQDFIRTARSKGLSERKVIWKHAFRNSVIPLITTAAGIFPALVGGSIVIEQIFSIPGMGTLVLFAISTNDHPMIIAVFTLIGIMTLIGILVADVLYAWSDPRISFSKSK